MRKILFGIAVVILSIMVSGCINPPPPPPSIPDSVFIYPTTIYTDLDSEFTVTVMANVASYIKGWECEVEYDNTELYLIKAEISTDLFGDSSTFSSPNILIDRTNGMVTRLYAVLLGEDWMVRRSGSLFNLTFVTDIYGTARINLKNCYLYNLTSAIPTKVTNATIIITSSFNI